MKAVAIVLGFIAACVVWIVRASVNLLVASWLVMLLVGGAHSTDGRVPAIGFATVLALVVAARIAVASGQAVASK